MEGATSADRRKEIPKERGAWTVYHDYEDDAFCDHFKVIGFFRTREQARTAVRDLKMKPGFIDHQKGFFVGRSTLNGGSWDEGFHTMMGDQSMPEPDLPIGLQTVLDIEIQNSDDGLWHVLHSYVDQWGCTETKPIGLYTDLELARKAVKDRLDQPGFRSRPAGFAIVPVKLGRVEYQDGF
jgi:hypothetical protein